MTEVLFAVLVIAGFYGLFVASVRVLDRAERQITQTVNEVAPRPADFAADLVPAQHQPALYDLTVHRVDTLLPPQQYRNISSFDLTRHLLDRDVPSYLACEESGDTTVNGSHITWAPSSKENS